MGSGSAVYDFEKFSSEVSRFFLRVFHNKMFITLTFFFSAGKLIQFYIILQGNRFDFDIFPSLRQSSQIGLLKIFQYIPIL